MRFISNPPALKDSNLETSALSQLMATSSASKLKKSVIASILSCLDGSQTISYRVCLDSTIVVTSLSRDIIVVIPNQGLCKDGEVKRGGIFNRVAKDLLGQLWTGG